MPYRWWLIDSWWHAFDNNTFFEDIPAQVGTLFPSGLRDLYQKLGEQPFGAHWSSTFNSASPYVDCRRFSYQECHMSAFGPIRGPSNRTRITTRFLSFFAGT